MMILLRSCQTVRSPLTGENPLNGGFFFITKHNLSSTNKNYSCILFWYEHNYVMKTERQKLVKDCDTLCSIYIRQKDAINDIATCYTCGKQDHRKKLQNGHFISRGCFALRRSPINLRVQCYRCNVALNGNYIEYTRKMIEEVWVDKVDELRATKYKIHKLSIQDLKDMKQNFTNLIEWNTDKQ